MKKIRVGVLGAQRGMSMILQLLDSKDAALVAICDMYAPSLQAAGRHAEKNGHPDIALFSDFDDFLEYPMDAVVLANYANAHAPFAIRCMNKGLHVMSEVLPVQTMAQAVELIETVERTGKIYTYAENYCYMPAPRHMRQLFREGKLGTFEYGEGEYMHNCEPIWSRITRGISDHWRNTMYATFYCTHSIGPLIHISGLRPVSVTAFEMPFNARMARMGAKAGHSAVEIITLENGAVIKSLHGVGCSCNSVWYSIYGSEGRLESAREDAEAGDVSRIYTNLTERNPHKLPRTYLPEDALTKDAVSSGHGGSDFFPTYYFLRKILGDPTAEIIDVYEALDMFLPGLLGYRSILNGGIPMAIPDLRDPAVREQYRNDHACTDPAVAGQQLLPSYSKGNPSIPEEVYRQVAEAYERSRQQKKQLMMLLFPRVRLPLGLPEGYSVTRYTGKEEEIDDWVRICKNGLLADDAGREAFEATILNFSNIDPYEDLFFITDPNGARVATVCALNNFQNTGLGGVHMVSVLESERGKGLSHALCRIAENKLANAKVTMARLTTDDWRKGACKAYLRAGWYPVNWDDDMPERWTAVIRALGMPSVYMLDEHGAPDRQLVANP